MATFKKVFRTAVDLKPVHIEKYDGVQTLTIPDQSMSVREILHRFTSGQELKVGVGKATYSETQVLYDMRRKHNIDIAEDRHEHEAQLINAALKVKDGKNQLRGVASASEDDERKRLSLGQSQKDVDTSPTDSA